MFRNIIRLLFFLLPLAGAGQTEIASWPLTSDYNSFDFNAQNLESITYSSGPGISEEALSNQGGEWSAFTSSNFVDSSDYLQIEIVPSQGIGAKNIYVSEIEMRLRQVPQFGFNGSTSFSIAYDKSVDFDNPIEIASGSLGTVFSTEDITLNIPIPVYAGESFFLRIFAFGSENLGFFSIRKNDFKIKGHIESASAVNPIQEISVSQLCEQNAIIDLVEPLGYIPDNQTLLIFAKADEPIVFGESTYPLATYNQVDPDFSTLSGTAFERDPNAHLVYKGVHKDSIEIVNLNPGTTYYFLAYNVSGLGGVGNYSGASFSVGSVSGALLDLNQMVAIGSSKQVQLSFTTPKCLDAVLIVAKEGIITQDPSGDGSAYIADPDFTGIGSDFDGGKVVYNSSLPSDTGIFQVFTGLTDGLIYYFKAFVRKGTSWSAGVQLSAVPNTSPLAITQVQSRGEDFVEFVTLSRIDISDMDLTDQGICEEGTFYRNTFEWETADFFNTSGNPDLSASLTDIPAGTYIRVYSNDFEVDTDHTDGLLTLRNSQLNLDENGDQVMLFKEPINGNIDECGLVANPISAAINFANSAGWINSGNPNENTSYRPDSPVSFETINNRPNSRIRQNGITGDSSALQLSIMNPTRWQHQNRSTDYWRLKAMLFHTSNYLSGDIVFTDTSDTQLELDLSNLVFDRVGSSTRYLVLVSEGSAPQHPANRYTCYNPTTDFALADSAVRTISRQFQSNLPCGESTTRGTGKVVYMDYGLPNSLTITNLSCDTEYTVRVYAINGNGASMRRGTHRQASVLTTSNVSANVYYSRGDGNLDDPIWSSTPSGPASIAPVSSPCSRLIVQSGDHLIANTELSIGELVVESGAHFELQTDDFSIQNNCTIDGVFIHNNNSITFNGKGTMQEIYTSSEVEFYNLIINRATVSQRRDLRVYGNLAIRNHLTLESGNIVVANGYTVRLISDEADRAASVTAVPNSSRLRGNFLVERYIPPIPTVAPPGSGNGVGWRYLAAPIKNATFQVWNDDFATTGIIGSDFPDYPHNINPALHYFPNFQLYDETVEGNRDVGYDGDQTGPAPTIRNRRSMDQPIEAGRGVFAYVGPVPTTFDAEGEIFKGNLTVNLSYTDHGTPNEDGWHLVANPYPSAINWDLVERSAEVSPFAYIYDATGSGNFILFDASDPNEDLIASSNAFWVKTMGEGSIRFRESHKSNDVNASFYKNLLDTDQLDVQLVATDDSTLHDHTILRILPEATLGYDFLYDAYKLYSINPSVPGLATQIEDIQEDFAINSFNRIDSSFHIPLKANTRVAGTYSLHFDVSGRKFNSYCISLLDLALDSQIVLSQNPDYVFYSEVNEVEDSARFMLLFEHLFCAQPIHATCFGEANGAISLHLGQEGSFAYGLYDAGQTLIDTGLVSQDTLFTGLGAGNYTLFISGFNVGCSAECNSIAIEQPPYVEPPLFEVSDAKCKDSDNGELFIQWNDSAMHDLELFYEGELVSAAFNVSVDYYFEQLAQGAYQVHVLDLCDTLIHTFDISYLDSMSLNFELQEDTVFIADGGYVFCENLSVNGMMYMWGFLPDQEEPIVSFHGEYYYQEEGEYPIVLAGQSAQGCFDFITKNVTVLDDITSIRTTANLQNEFKIQYLHQAILLNYNVRKGGTFLLNIQDGLGRQIHSETANFDQHGMAEIEGLGLSKGIYYLSIEDEQGEMVTLRFFAR